MAKIEVAMGKKAKSKRHMGNLNLCSSDLPELKNSKIGDKVEVIVEVEVTSLRKPDEWEIEEYGHPKDSVQMGSEILSIKSKNAQK